MPHRTTTRQNEGMYDREPSEVRDDESDLFQYGGKLTCDENRYAGQSHPGQVTVGFWKSGHQVEVHSKCCGADGHSNTWIRKWKSKLCCRAMKDYGCLKTLATWDDEKELPSSLVHDQCCYCSEDDLNQTHDHRRQVTLLQSNKDIHITNLHFHWKAFMLGILVGWQLKNEN